MRIKNNLMMLILFSLFGILVCAPISAQPAGECTNDVAASAFDDECGFLDAKIFDLDTDPLRKGIDVELDGTGVYPDRNAFLRIGFDSIEVGNRTWWNGNSDFTWYFNAAGDDNPSLAFKNNQTTHTGKFNVEATSETNLDSFAGAFKLYQTGWIRGSTTMPIATDGTLIYGVDGSGEQPINFDEVTFHHGEPHTSGPDFEAAGVKQCDLIKPNDGANIWYIIEQVENTDLLLRSVYYNPVNPPEDWTGSAVVQPQACGVKALQASIDITDGGHVTDAYGLYLAQIDDPSNTVTNKWGLYQAGEDYFNYMGGRLAIGADVDGYYPTNTVIYLDKHYDWDDTLSSTNYGGYFEVTQESSLYVEDENRFPATLECKYTYDTTEDTAWPPLGWDIRTKVIDGRFMIVNSG